nr:glycerophosphodiester phosphodiesterase family protein [Candidatus Sigynarchaeum springense]
MVLLIGHRGFRVGVVENTLQAFSLAVARGMDYIELDVQLSADHEVFVLHDASLDRTMGVTGQLAELTASQVDAFNATRGDAGVPRLLDVFERVLLPSSPAARPRLMVELKGAGTGIATGKLVMARHVEDVVVFSGKDLRELAAAHETAPRVPLCLNITSCKEFTKKQLVEASCIADLPLPFAMISLRAREVGKEFIHACHRLGARALAWDFVRERRPADALERLVRQGLDGALIDDPAMVEESRSRILHALGSPG